jgi:hypothetical protein
MINTADMKALLKSNTVEVTFTKVNGEQRVMTCTLKEDVIPKYEKKTESVRVKSDSSVSCFDVNANGWRSFKPENVISFKVIG